MGEWVEKKWKDVCVGDIVRVLNTKSFPADLILLASSEPQGMCYIETANLDGETNLKIRSALAVTSEFTDKSQLSQSNFRGTMVAELPNRYRLSRLPLRLALKHRSIFQAIV